MDYQMKELVQRCKAGDLTAKEELLINLRPLILSSIRKYYFGKEELEDLLQEGYLKLLLEIKRFDESKGVPFLGYVKLQLKYFYMEKGKKHLHEIINLHESRVSDEQISLIDMLADQEADIETRLVEAEDRVRLGQALKRLSKKQRQIIYLHYGEGFNMRVIAGQLGVHYQTVVKTKDRAVKKIRNMFNRFRY